jgi:hypothetical protein
MTLLSVRVSRRAALILACAAAFVPAAVRAQTPVRPGSVLRILAPSVADSLLTGTVIKIDSASLLLSPPASAASLTVALRDIERLEVRGPGAPRTSTGALVGAVAGAVAGYAVCHMASGSPHANCQKAPGAAAGATVGLLLGMEIGMTLRGPARWQTVPVPHVGAAPLN